MRTVVLPEVFVQAPVALMEGIVGSVRRSRSQCGECEQSRSLPNRRPAGNPGRSLDDGLPTSVLSSSSPLRVSVRHEMTTTGADDVVLTMVSNSLFDFFTMLPMFGSRRWYSCN